MVVALPPMPDRMKLLKRDERGFPVPWFVHWQDDKPDFRVISPGKLGMAYRNGRCWICGGQMGAHRIYVIGPMCVINRVTSEPASHRDCAEFAARACPFLTKPRMRRNEKDLPEGRSIAGVHLDRNPGCVALYETKSVSPFKAGDGYLFRLGDPDRIDWWAEGRQATREEVLASIDSGYPILLDTATKHDGPDGVKELTRMRDAAMRYLPAAA
jgi:hypothetical protein